MSRAVLVLRRFLAGARALFRSKRDEQDLDEELRAYLETSVSARVAGGMSPQDAERTARPWTRASLIRCGASVWARAP